MADRPILALKRKPPVEGTTAPAGSSTAKKVRVVTIPARTAPATPATKAPKSQPTAPARAKKQPPPPRVVIPKIPPTLKKARALLVRIREEGGPKTYEEIRVGYRVSERIARWVVKLIKGEVP